MCTNILRLCPPIPFGLVWNYVCEFRSLFHHSFFLLHSRSPSRESPRPPDFLEIVSLVRDEPVVGDLDWKGSHLAGLRSMAAAALVRFSHPPEACTEEDLCELCLQPLGSSLDRLRWSCAQCFCEIHEDCHYEWFYRDSQTLPSGTRQRTPRDHDHNSLFRRADRRDENQAVMCPRCRVTYRKLQDLARQPVATTETLNCAVCLGPVPAGEEAQRCAHYLDRCSAWWHPACASVRWSRTPAGAWEQRRARRGEGCPGCGESLFRAILGRARRR